MFHIYHTLIRTAIVACMGLSLTGCSLISISLPSSLFGVDDPKEKMASPYSGKKESSWWNGFMPEKDPATFNRRRPVYNPKNTARHASMPPQMPTTYNAITNPYGNSAMNVPAMGRTPMSMPGSTGGMPSGGFSDFYAQMPGGAPNTAAAPTYHQTARPHAPSTSGNMGNGFSSGYDMPSFSGYETPSISGPSDVQIQQGLQSLGWGKNSSGNYNPWVRHKEEVTFEPMAASYTLTIPQNITDISGENMQLAWLLEDSFRRLTEVPQKPEELRGIEEKKSSFHSLEEERDQANQLNNQLRTTEHEALISDQTEERTKSTSENKLEETASSDPTFLEKLQQAITIEVDENNPYFTDHPHQHRSSSFAPSQSEQTTLSPESHNNQVNKGQNPSLKTDTLRIADEPVKIQYPATTPSHNAPPVIKPYQAPEGIVLKPSRYKIRRDAM